MIHVVGAGLAGAEAAWQAVSRGVAVTLHEMRPVRATDVHTTDRFAELVCSNSFRSDKLDNAVGLLKHEMRRLGSLVMRVADEVRVPAGAALAVDRGLFSARVTAALSSHPLVQVVRGEVEDVPEPSAAGGPVVLATGPLTSAPLSASLAALVGRTHLHFYDAVSPIVLAETIDPTRVFRASRWGRSLGPAAGASAERVSLAGNEAAGDYLNCPLTEEEYSRFHEAVRQAARAEIHQVDRASFFEGCLPIEVMAERGLDTLRFGPMKPVGLLDPRTGRQPYAVVQLRQDTLAADHYSLVGFQTQMTWGEQARVLRLIPGLEHAEFVRFGMVHRNTYVDSPAILAETGELRVRPGVYLAGQVSGVEGYVESAASGLLAGLLAAGASCGRQVPIPPRTTAHGALAYYVSHAETAGFQPSNITFGIMAPLEPLDRRLRRDRRARHEAISARALADLDIWRARLDS